MQEQLRRRLQQLDRRRGVRRRRGWFGVFSLRVRFRLRRLRRPQLPPTQPAAAAVSTPSPAATVAPALAPALSAAGDTAAGAPASVATSSVDAAPAASAATLPAAAVVAATLTALAAAAAVPDAAPFPRLLLSGGSSILPHLSCCRARPAAFPTPPARAALFSGPAVPAAAHTTPTDFALTSAAAHVAICPAASHAAIGADSRLQAPSAAAALRSTRRECVRQ